MTATEKLICDALKNHIKIHEVMWEENLFFSCEVDRIQSIARAIVKRIVSEYGNFNIISTTRGVKHMGFTKVLVKGKIKENNGK